MILMFGLGFESHLKTSLMYIVLLRHVANTDYKVLGIGLVFQQTNYIKLIVCRNLILM